jgi:pimeloyl-ACP methyl ester carboxylesterase
MRMDQTIKLGDGRTVGFATFGPHGGTPVVYCHGGPGSRLEPTAIDVESTKAGHCIIGIDRPGYGLSTPLEGRTIGQWISDGLAVADELGIDEFYVNGVSTGGAYALALAAAAPRRVLGVIACCSMTDMRFEPARSKMGAYCHAVWNAPNRSKAMEEVIAFSGEDGTRMLVSDSVAPLPPADLELFSDPDFFAAYASSFPAGFAQGVVGYADDRLADGPGWASFDVSSIECPVTVLHGRADSIVDVVNAEYTATIVPNAKLSLHDDLGHFSITTKLVSTTQAMTGQ